MDFTAPLPARYADVLQWFDANQPPAEVHAWRNQWDTEPPDSGLTLLGPPATGKTTTAAWLAADLLARHGVGHGYVTSLRYQRSLQTQISVENLISGASGEDWQTLYERHSNVEGWTRWLRTECPLLVFDDWGKEHTTHTGFIEDQIEFLLRDRYDRALPTILTGNLGLTSIEKRFGASMASFVFEAFPPVVMDGRDRRRS